MKITILTLFPEVFSQIINTSILKRAQEKKLVDIQLVNIRDFTSNSYKTVDDRPYGGGVGMVMRVDVIDRAISNVKSQMSNLKKTKIILLDARGKTFDQKKAGELSKLEHLVLICGHYEGVDERVKNLVNESISIGNYVLTGGEIPAMVIVDAVTRLIPGVLKKPEATINESFSELMTNDQRPTANLEYPQYTRPPVFKGQKVPEVLLSGNHAQIAKWRKSQQRKVIAPTTPDVSR